MAMILFDEGKKVGEISDWNLIVQPPVYKNILGKEVLSSPSKQECTFTSPKPVTRKSKLTIKEDGKKDIALELKSVKGGTLITAVIAKS
jgi:hypothetical protein